MTLDETATRPVIVMGGGGHGRVVIDALYRAGRRVLGVCDPNSDMVRGLPADVPYLGGDEALAAHAPDTVALANGVGSISNTDARRKLYERCVAQGYQFTTFCHPSATIAADVALGPGTQIHAGVIVQTGVRIAADVLVNTGAQLDHDCEIGDHTHLAPGVLLSGGVRVGASCHLGTGAIVIQNVTIGSGTLVAAGAVVVRDVEPNSRYRRASDRIR